MNKEEALKIFIGKIYKSDTKLVLTENEVKKINMFYKNSFLSVGGFEEYSIKNQEQFKNIKKLKSGLYEIKKQYKRNKALQSGILSECNYIETIAKVFGLKKCIDLDNTVFNKIPKECTDYINSSSITFSSARYLYYNPGSTDVFLFQYGNPANGDAEIIIGKNKIRLEFKERKSKAGEYDITGLYNEEGKLIISENFRKNNAEYIPFIEKFNEETNIIEQIGHNYNNFDEEMKKEPIKKYFDRHNIDILISSTENNLLIAITPDCLDIGVDEETRIITTENSEIRISGRNCRKIFTEDLFYNCLKAVDVVEIKNGEYKVDLKNNRLVEMRKGRGKNVITRIRINKIFFIKRENAIIENNMLTFSKKDVYQLIPSISMHIEIKATKELLKEYYKEIIGD
ncbi:MAG: hypothetical protein Q4G05_01425 [Clostridia bacterium]|nr:hypothetical protein [Clostridia bacterium]